MCHMSRRREQQLYLSLVKSGQLQGKPFRMEILKSDLKFQPFERALRGTNEIMHDSKLRKKKNKLVFFLTIYRISELGNCVSRIHIRKIFAPQKLNILNSDYDQLMGKYI